jgi:hypothetical protein
MRELYVAFYVTYVWVVVPWEDAVNYYWRFCCLVPVGAAYWIDSERHQKIII